MNSSDSHAGMPVDIDRLLKDTVGVALATQQRPEYFEWLNGSLRQYLNDIEIGRNPEAIRILSTTLGRTLWNAIPLPRLGFRADTIPEPGRNDPCLCGSGRKYKHCCRTALSLPALDESAVWPVLLSKLSDEQRSAAFAARRVPIPALVFYAEELVAERKHGEAIELLQACVEPAFDIADEQSAVLIDALANAYDEIMDEAAKLAFLRRATALPKPSPLRAEAWARLATINMDEGDSDAAWQAFARAKSDWPKSEALPFLEITLLVADERKDEARTRARALLAKVLRRGASEDDPQVAFLNEVIEDPEMALRPESIFDDDDAEPSPLREWLDGVPERRVPAYSIAPDTALQAANLDPPSPNAGVLVGPIELREVEAQWHEVFGLAKPFSIHEAPAAAGDVWSAGKTASWLAFLEEHAEAFDSIDILDDLATALTMHPASDSEGYEDDLNSVLSRVRNITAVAQTRAPGVHLYWISSANRPALRSIYRLHSQCVRWYDETPSLEYADWLLALNPHDNHGVRCWLVNELLAGSNDERVLEIAAHYPNDYFPETRYGRALALHRLGRNDEARAALIAAYRDLPKVVRYLVQDEIEEPELHDLGVRPGGDDQAWLYREDMRDVWVATPGALDLLKLVAT